MVQPTKATNGKRASSSSLEVVATPGPSTGSFRELPCNEMDNQVTCEMCNCSTLETYLKKHIQYNHMIHKKNIVDLIYQLHYPPKDPKEPDRVMTETFSIQTQTAVSWIDDLHLAPLEALESNWEQPSNVSNGRGKGKGRPPQQSCRSVEITPLYEPEGRDISPVKNERDHCPACGKAENGIMIACDGCDGWYHCLCVGITQEPAPDLNWFCSQCNTTNEPEDIPDDLCDFDDDNVEMESSNIVTAPVEESVVSNGTDSDWITVTKKDKNGKKKLKKTNETKGKAQDEVARGRNTSKKKPNSDCEKSVEDTSTQSIDKDRSKENQNKSEPPAHKSVETAVQPAKSIEIEKSIPEKVLPRSQKRPTRKSNIAEENIESASKSPALSEPVINKANESITSKEAPKKDEIEKIKTSNKIGKKKKGNKLTKTKIKTTLEKQAAEDENKVVTDKVLPPKDPSPVKNSVELQKAQTPIENASKTKRSEEVLEKDTAVEENSRRSYRAAKSMAQFCISSKEMSKITKDQIISKTHTCNKCNEQFSTKTLLNCHKCNFKEKEMVPTPKSDSLGKLGSVLGSADGITGIKDATKKDHASHQFKSEFEKMAEGMISESAKTLGKKGIPEPALEQALASSKTETLSEKLTNVGKKTGNEILLSGNEKTVTKNAKKQGPKSTNVEPEKEVCNELAELKTSPSVRGKKALKRLQTSAAKEPLLKRSTGDTSPKSTSRKSLAAEDTSLLKSSTICKRSGKQTASSVRKSIESKISLIESKLKQNSKSLSTPIAVNVDENYPKTDIETDKISEVVKNPKEVDIDVVTEVKPEQQTKRGNAKFDVNKCEKSNTQEIEKGAVVGSKSEDDKNKAKRGRSLKRKSDQVKTDVDTPESQNNKSNAVDEISVVEKKISEPHNVEENQAKRGRSSRRKSEQIKMESNNKPEETISNADKSLCDANKVNGESPTRGRSLKRKSRHSEIENTSSIPSAKNGVVDKTDSVTYKNSDTCEKSESAKRSRSSKRKSEEITGENSVIDACNVKSKEKLKVLVEQQQFNSDPPALEDRKNKSDLSNSEGEHTVARSSRDKVHKVKSAKEIQEELDQSNKNEEENEASADIGRSRRKTVPEKSSGEMTEKHFFRYRCKKCDLVDFSIEVIEKHAFESHGVKPVEAKKEIKDQELCLWLDQPDLSLVDKNIGLKCFKFFADKNVERIKHLRKDFKKKKIFKGIANKSSPNDEDVDDTEETSSEDQTSLMESEMIASEESSEVNDSDSASSKQESESQTEGSLKLKISLTKNKVIKTSPLKKIPKQRKMSTEKVSLSLDFMAQTKKNTPQRSRLNLILDNLREKKAKKDTSDDKGETSSTDTDSSVSESKLETSVNNEGQKQVDLSVNDKSKEELTSSTEKESITKNKNDVKEGLPTCHAKEKEEKDLELLSVRKEGEITVVENAPVFQCLMCEEKVTLQKDFVTEHLKRHKVTLDDYSKIFVTHRKDEDMKFVRIWADEDQVNNEGEELDDILDIDGDDKQKPETTRTKFWRKQKEEMAGRKQYPCLKCNKVMTSGLAFRNHQKVHSNVKRTSRRSTTHEDEDISDKESEDITDATDAEELINQDLEELSENVNKEYQHKKLRILNTSVVVSMDERNSADQELEGSYSIESGDPDSRPATPDNQDYKCFHCGEEFKAAYLLNVHYRTKHFEKIHQCKQCPKTYFSVPELEQHELVHKMQGGGVTKDPGTSHRPGGRPSLALYTLPGTSSGSSKKSGEKKVGKLKKGDIDNTCDTVEDTCDDSEANVDSKTEKLSSLEADKEEAVNIGKDCDTTSEKDDSLTSKLRKLRKVTSTSKLSHPVAALIMPNSGSESQVAEENQSVCTSELDTPKQQNSEIKAEDAKEIQSVHPSESDTFKPQNLAIETPAIKENQSVCTSGSDALRSPNRESKTQEVDDTQAVCTSESDAYKSANIGTSTQEVEENQSICTSESGALKPKNSETKTQVAEDVHSICTSGSNENKPSKLVAVPESTSDMSVESRAELRGTTSDESTKQAAAIMEHEMEETSFPLSSTVADSIKDIGAKETVSEVPDSTTTVDEVSSADCEKSKSPTDDKPSSTGAAYEANYLQFVKAKPSLAFEANYLQFLNAPQTPTWCSPSQSDYKTCSSPDNNSSDFKSCSSSENNSVSGNSTLHTPPCSTTTQDAPISDLQDLSVSSKPPLKRPYTCQDCDGCKDICDHEGHTVKLREGDISEHIKQTGHKRCWPAGSEGEEEEKQSNIPQEIPPQMQNT